VDHDRTRAPPVAGALPRQIGHQRGSRGPLADCCAVATKHARLVERLDIEIGRRRVQLEDGRYVLGVDGTGIDPVDGVGPGTLEVVGQTEVVAPLAGLDDPLFAEVPAGILVFQAVLGSPGLLTGRVRLDTL
jgi:hypothetical protein